MSQGGEEPVAAAAQAPRAPSTADNEVATPGSNEALLKKTEESSAESTGKKREREREEEVDKAAKDSGAAEEEPRAEAEERKTVDEDKKEELIKSDQLEQPSNKKPRLETDEANKEEANQAAHKDHELATHGNETTAQ